MIKAVCLSEKMLVYGNRFRSSYEEIDMALTKAEELFRRGKYRERWVGSQEKWLYSPLDYNLSPSHFSSLCPRFPICKIRALNLLSCGA